jgi:hypothetical protein
MDLIERQAAIDAIANCTNCGDEKTLRAYVQKHNLDNGWTGGVLEAIDAIEDLSSAQPETAKRIVGKSKDGMTLWYQCDMCNEPVDAQDNFCRGCGRRLTDG